MRRILIKPLITEKSDNLANDLNQYTFLVDRKANKIQIKGAVEERYNVAVKGVSTMIIPGKMKTKYTKTGVQRGTRPAYKKAIIRVAEGDTINFYGEI